MNGDQCQFNVSSKIRNRIVLTFITWSQCDIVWEVVIIVRYPHTHVRTITLHYKDRYIHIHFIWWCSSVHVFQCFAVTLVNSIIPITLKLHSRKRKWERERKGICVSIMWWQRLIILCTSVHDEQKTKNNH